MEGGDLETVLAYYCFINHGWPPSQFAELPFRERILIKVFVDKQIQLRNENKR